MQKKYVLPLTTEERAQLEAMVKKSKAAAHKIKHAHILMTADVAVSRWLYRTILDRSRQFTAIPQRAAPA